MEFINEFKNLLANMSEEVKQLNDAFMELDSRMKKEARYIDRINRIARINALKASLVSEVDRIQQEDGSSERIFNVGKVYNGIFGFAAGSITGAILKQENPLSSGYKLFSTELEKKACFGTVMMAMKKGGNWQDIKVIAISRLAREASTTEADIISSLKRKGYSLMTPEKIWKYLDELKVIEENE